MGVQSTLCRFGHHTTSAFAAHFDHFPPFDSSGRLPATTTPSRKARVKDLKVEFRRATCDQVHRGRRLHSYWHVYILIDEPSLLAFDAGVRFCITGLKEISYSVASRFAPQLQRPTPLLRPKTQLRRIHDLRAASRSPHTTMMEPHTALGIAQTIFYVPMVPLAIWLFKRNGKIRPRMAWWPLVPFTLSTFEIPFGFSAARFVTPRTNMTIVRLAGGPIIIAMEKDRENIGLFIAALILLNVGVIPLIVADLGMTRIMYVLKKLRSVPLTAVLWTMGDCKVGC